MSSTEANDLLTKHGLDHLPRAHPGENMTEFLFPLFDNILTRLEKLEEKLHD